MIASVRAQLPYIPYEFIITDAGSTDGTIAWCQTQPDIVLIEEGERRGAIRAFTDAAKRAQGEYVVMANDDIVFAQHSLLAAIAHLEDNPQCGAVAFRDLSCATYKDGLGRHAARTADGQSVTNVYAQVGMYPRWLGDACGWWGGDHPAMSKARTYAADQFLSSRVWQAGYTIDTVRGADIFDRLAQDELRATNSAQGDADNAIYWGLFPDGAVFGSEPIARPEKKQRLRILYAPIHETGPYHATQRAQKRGLREALARVGIVYEYDYLWRLHRDKVDSAQELAAIALAFKPDILLTQVHAYEGIDAACIRTIRRALPECVVLNWNGDPWHEIYFDAQAVALFKHYDAQLVVDASTLARYAQLGVHADYWQDASETPTAAPEVAAHDVVFQGNLPNAQYRNSRLPMIEAIKATGCDVGVYGIGWPERLRTGDTNYDVNTMHALYANAKIAVSDMSFPESDAYFSNRLFNTLHAGTLLLHQHIPNIQARTGITPGRHFIEWHTLDELADLVRYYLANEAERARIARAGQRYIRRWHTYDTRVKELLTRIIPNALDARRKNANP